MSKISDYLKGSLNPKNAIATIKHNILFARNNPDYFYPDGIWVFCGPQGSGKTLSAVQCLQKICKEYPKALVVSNLDVKGIDNAIVPFENYEQLKEMDNGIYGIIFFLTNCMCFGIALKVRIFP